MKNVPIFAMIALTAIIIALIAWAYLHGLAHRIDSYSPTDDIVNMEATARTEGQGTEPLVKYTFDDLLDAIRQAESGGNVNAIGDGGEAVGAYQIHKIYVDDVNRILELSGVSPCFKYYHRMDIRISRLMTQTYVKHYTQNLLRFDDMSYYELCARIHNGGPDGWKKESTKAYWKKVKAAMEGVR